MTRLGLALGALLCVGCATTPRTTDLVLKGCQADVGSDARCVALLTDPQDGYEAKAEVKAAEQVREAGVFNDRLARLRAAHEARIGANITTSSKSATRLLGLVPPAVEPDLEPDALERELALVAQEDRVDTGSSLRAIKVAVLPPPPVVVRPKLPIRASSPTFGPIPAHWLAAASCLLRADQTALMAVMAGARGKASRRTLGGLALVLLDVQGMLTRIEAEQSHRRLAKIAPLCRSSNLELASNHLRAQLGPVVTRASQAERYGRRLRRFTDVLVTRAGLPRAQ